MKSMKKLIKKIPNFNEAGVTLVELLVAVAIMGGMGLLVAGLAVSLNQGSLQTQYDAEITEYMSKLSLELSKRDTCNSNFQNESMTQASTGALVDSNGKVLIQTGTTGPAGFTVSEVSMAQGATTRADITVKFTRNDAKSQRASQLSRKVRINVVPDATVPTKISSCSFDVVDISDQALSTSCFGQGVLLNTNDTPTDYSDDTCQWAGYSPELCPTREGVARYKLVDVSTVAGKIVPMYVPVCVSLDIPKSVACPGNQVLMGYNGETATAICRALDISDVSGFLVGGYQDISSVAVLNMGKVTEGSVNTINITGGTPIPTATASPTPSSGVWSLLFSATPTFPGTDYSVSLKLNGTPVAVATATYRPIAIYAQSGPCSGPNTELGLSTYTSSKDCRYSSPYSSIWSANPRTCNIDISTGAWSENVGVVAVAYTDSTKTTILAKTSCVPYAGLTATPTPGVGTPTATPTPTPTLPAGSPTPSPTPTPTATANCAVPYRVTLQTLNAPAQTGTISGTIDAATHVGGGSTFVNYIGDFDQTFNITTLGSIDSMAATYSTVNPTSATAALHKAQRGIYSALYITPVKPNARKIEMIPLLAHSTFASAFWAKLSNPTCTSNCNYNSATNTIPAYNTADSCWTGAVPINYRIKRIGDTIYWGCNNAGTASLTYSMSIAGCGMDNGLYSGFVIKFWDGYGDNIDGGDSFLIPSLPSGALPSDFTFTN